MKALKILEHHIGPELYSIQSTHEISIKISYQDKKYFTDLRLCRNPSYKYHQDGYNLLKFFTSDDDKKLKSEILHPSLGILAVDLAETKGYVRSYLRHFRYYSSSKISDDFLNFCENFENELNNDIGFKENMIQLMYEDPDAFRKKVYFKRKFLEDFEAFENFGMI